MKIRPAVLSDVSEIAGFLQELAYLGKRNLPSDADYVRNHYVQHSDNIQCSVAEAEDGSLLGLQILKRAAPDNDYGVTPGWGIIGTHIRPAAARRGVGRALFAATEAAARSAGLPKIDATIGADNDEGLGYYEAMGFRSYQTAPGRVSKCFEVPAAAPGQD